MATPTRLGLLLQLTEVISTAASFAVCFVHEDASLSAAKDFCKLRAVPSPAGHLCDLVSTATRMITTAVSSRNPDLTRMM